MKADSAPNATQASERDDVPATPGSPRAKRLAISAILIVLLLAAGIGFTAWMSRSRPDAPRREDTSLPPLVEVRTLALREIREVFTGYGSARADREVTISAEVSGRVVEVAEGLKDGSPVADGQVLIRIDDREYGRRLERADGQWAEIDARLAELKVDETTAGRLAEIARDEVEVTHSEYKRLTELYERQVASKKEWDFARLEYQRSRRELQTLEKEVRRIEPRRAQLKAQRDARRADKELAQLILERCTITAPFAGRVEEIFVEQGDQVRPGGQVLRIIAPRHIEVPVELPASVYPRTKVGAACTLWMESLPDVRWEAPVRRISPATDERSRTFTAYIEVDNATQATPLVPGYFVTAEVSGPILRDVLVVPRGALVGDQVFVANEGKAHPRKVSVDRLIGDQAVVSGDLAPGDRVILTNLDMLYDGAAVRCSDRVEAVTQRDDPGTAEGDG